MGSMANPRDREVARALAGFQARADHGRVPKRRRYGRVVGGVVGSHRHARGKRNRQRQAAFNWTYRRGTF